MLMMMKKEMFASLNRHYKDGKSLMVTLLDPWFKDKFFYW